MAEVHKVIETYQITHEINGDSKNKIHVVGKIIKSVENDFYRLELNYICENAYDPLIYSENIEVVREELISYLESFNDSDIIKMPL